jgi:prolyl oligopeptidase
MGVNPMTAMETIVKTEITLRPLAAMLVVLAFSALPNLSSQEMGSHNAAFSLSDGALAPVAPIRPVVDDYFGTKIIDPYRYMENLKDPDVEKWFKDQDAHTRNVLAHIPGREVLLARIQVLDQAAPYRVFDIQRLRGGKYFYQKKLATENTSKLYERDGTGGPEKLLIDPDRFAKDPGTHFTLSYYVPSPDARFVAYGVSPSGSEDAVIHILDISSGQDLSEAIERSWYGGISWMPDNQSFVHIQLQPFRECMAANERRLKSRVLLHRVGTNPDTDIPVFGFDVNQEIKLDPSDGSFVLTDPRTTSAIACINHGFDNDMTCYAAPVDSLNRLHAPWQKLFDTEDQITNLDIRDDSLYLMSHKDAPRFKIIRTSILHHDLAHAETVVTGGNSVITNIVAGTDA